MFASRIHRLIKLGLSIEDSGDAAADGAAAGGDDDLPPLESDNAVAEASAMETVD